MSSSETDEDGFDWTDDDVVYPDEDENGFDWTDDDVVYPYESSSDGSDEDTLLIDRPRETKTAAFYWKDDLRQRFMRFFQDDFSAKAAERIEEFARRHSLNDGLMSDLLELLIMLFGKTICSSGHHSSSTSTGSQISPSKKAVPDSTVSAAEVNRENSSIQEISGDGTTNKAMHSISSSNLKAAGTQSAYMLALGSTTESSTAGKIITAESSNKSSSVQEMPGDGTTNKTRHSILSSNLKAARTQSAYMSAIGSTTEGSSAGKIITVESSNKRPAETSAKCLVKRKLVPSDEPPSKRKADFESVMERREHGTVFCKVCEVSCTSKKNGFDHLRGKAHKKNVEKSKKPAVQQKKKSGDAKAVECQPTTTSQRSADENDGRIYCEVCNVSISGTDNAKAHYTGKQHMKKMKRQKEVFVLRCGLSQSKVGNSDSSQSIPEMSCTPQVQIPIIASEIRSNTSGSEPENPICSQLHHQITIERNIKPADEIVNGSNVTQKLRELYREGQIRLENEPDDCE